METIINTQLHENKECKEVLQEFLKWFKHPNPSEDEAKKSFEIVQNFIDSRKKVDEIKRLEEIRINTQNNLEYWEKEMYSSSGKQAKYNFYEAVNDLKLLDEEIKRLTR